MTPEIFAVLSILVISLILFVTEKLRMDVVALLVLTTLALSRLITPTQALAGFSNPAVITVWAMFILSAGLSKTGVADIIGKRVLKLAGTSEPRIIITIMLTTGILSAFMNNIGVAALMLPVVMDIAKRTQVPPSRLLMPMAYSSLLGGLTTLIGTPPNLVAANSLEEAGYEPFGLFDFAPIGVPALITGTLFIAFVGRHLLPSVAPKKIHAPDNSTPLEADLESHQFQIHIRSDSPLHGKSLEESGLGPLLGLQVLSITRGQQTSSNPSPQVLLQRNDNLQVLGQPDNLLDLQHWKTLELAQGPEIAPLLQSQKLVLVTATLAADSPLVGLTVKESDFRKRFNAHILTLKNGSQIHRGDLSSRTFEANDLLQVEIRKDSVDLLRDSPHFNDVEFISEDRLGDIYPDTNRLIELRIPESSSLTGTPLRETGLSDTLGLRILGIARPSGSVHFPSGSEIIEAHDQLLVHGKEEHIELLRALQSLELLDAPAPPATGQITIQATLSPQSSLAGKTIKELDFRNRHGVRILSLWRQQHVHRSHLRNIKLQFGDALLLSGPQEKIAGIANNPDLIPLTSVSAKITPPAPHRTILATLIMAGVVILALTGTFPIAIAAIAGASIMIATSCLNIEDAYKAIEWKAVFLIACMIPLGAAMNESGAAQWIGNGIAHFTSPFGPWALIIGLYLATMLATTIVPTTALVVIMASIGIDAASSFNLPPDLIVMAIAMAASASFTSPISHPANVLVMGPGGYRFVDYVKMGLWLALVVMITVLPMMALRWSF